MQRQHVTQLVHYRLQTLLDVHSSQDVRVPHRSGMQTIATRDHEVGKDHRLELGGMHPSPNVVCTVTPLRRPTNLEQRPFDESTTSGYAAFLFHELLCKARKLMNPHF